MGYLSFQIIFFLLLAALLGFIIGWLLRASRFQSELQDLDGRWRAKLGEVEGERDRFVAELTQANEAKTRSEADLKRLSETHESSVQTLKREHQAEIAAFADTKQSVAGLKSDLDSKNDEIGRIQADLAKARQTGGDVDRLGRELAAAGERATTLERSLEEARTAQENCRSEVERLKAEIADLKRRGGATADTASAGGAMGLMSGGGGVSSSTGSGGGVRDAGVGSTGSGFSTAGAGASAGSAGVSGDTDRSSAGNPGGVGASGGSGSSHTQRAASPSHLADAGAGTSSNSGSGQTASGSATGPDDQEGVRPAALASARDGRADDLKLISGVGPKLEKTLNGLGIFHFWQIAEFTPDNVAWVDRHLRFKGRIERENWISQAKILAAGGETEFSRRQ